MLSFDRAWCTVERFLLYLRESDRNPRGTEISGKLTLGGFHRIFKHRIIWHNLKVNLIVYLNIFFRSKAIWTLHLQHFRHSEWQQGRPDVTQSRVDARCSHWSHQTWWKRSFYSNIPQRTVNDQISWESGKYPLTKHFNGVAFHSSLI